MKPNTLNKQKISTAIPTILTPNKLKIAQLQVTLKTPYKLIDTAFNLETALQPFQQAKIIAIDCETTGLDPYQAKIRLLQRKDSGLKEGNKLRNSQVTRMGRNSLTEKSHY